MTYAGAHGETASQIASALHFTLPPCRLHPAFGALDDQLESRAGAADASSIHPFHLDVASSLWAQSTLQIRHAFLQTLDDDYGSPLELTDFADDPDAALLAMNQWTSDETGGLIPQLFAPGSITSDERLVILDAIDFGASWAAPFEVANTALGPFTGDDGTTGSVPMMNQRGLFGYAAGDGWQAVSLPYSGDSLSMVAILPAAGSFDSFEAGLDADRISAITAGLAVTDVTLTLPKFALDPGSLSLRPLLQSLGMTDAFDPARADFSRVTVSQTIEVGDVVHRAFVSVDENGTQAAAATGVTVVGTWVAANGVTMTLDHPFVYAIRDDVSGTILFLGRMTSP
jgi:serpin B